MSMETPLRKVRGMGSAHTGASHFIYQRVTAAALVPLTLWFAVSVIGLVGVGEVDAMMFLSLPMHAILMGLFVLTLLYHLALGLQEVIIDYVPHQIFKFLLIFAVYGFAVIAAFFCLFALASIAIA
jgi:succinate dehydrogenase / fumarate reductase, membrane anchor subunit